MLLVLRENERRKIELDTVWSRINGNKENTGQLFF
jgi:hypothetical protein